MKIEPFSIILFSMFGIDFTFISHWCNENQYDDSLEPCSPKNEIEFNLLYVIFYLYVPIY